MIKCYPSSWWPNRQCLQALRHITEISHSSFYDILTFASGCQLTAGKNNKVSQPWDAKRWAVDKDNDYNVCIVCRETPGL